jgi:ribosome recycling factor
MTTKQIVSTAEDRMKKSVEAFRHELAGIKAGRATPAILDRIRVDYYGTPTPVNQVANIEVTDSRTLTLKPWDRSTIKLIEKAIQISDLGINPGNDGIVIRLVLPAMTEQRRKELVKLVQKRTEEERVVIRNVRRDANDQIKKAEKDRIISEDESKGAHDEIQKLTDKLIKEVDHVLDQKEKEIMEV